MDRSILKRIFSGARIFSAIGIRSRAGLRSLRLLPGAKARHNEFWIKGKVISGISNTAKIISQAKQLIGREIKHISSFFPYDLKRFQNSDFICTKSLLIFGSFGFENCKDLARVENIERIKNLLAGVELLSLGITFHFFCTDEAIAYPVKANTEKEDKKYNLDLLFGDIFYSRAVIYLLGFKDHLVFDEILSSLKITHMKRLELHQKLLRFIGSTSFKPKAIKEDGDLFVGVNSLFKTSFEIGNNIFDPDNISGHKNISNKIIDNIVALKFYYDIKYYFNSIPPASHAAADMEYFTGKIDFINSRVSDIISELKSRWLADNFRDLIDSIKK